MCDRDDVVAMNRTMNIGSVWTVTEWPDRTEFMLGSRLDLGPKVDIWWNPDGSARLATSYDGDGEPMETVETNVLDWLRRELW